MNKKIGLSSMIARLSVANAGEGKKQVKEATYTLLSVAKNARGEDEMLNF